MGASYEEMNKHVIECNKDFNESVIKKFQTIKLGHKNELFKWVSIQNE